MARVPILTGDAAESLEVLYPYQRPVEDPADYVAVVVPGGRTPESIRNDHTGGTAGARRLDNPN